MKRWLVALFGIVLAAAAFLAVATARRASLLRRPEANPLPHAEIDDSSRAQLERVLRDSEHEERRPK